ncbi:MAG: L,D-transpeptidase [Acidimicrobiales bacterium]
MPPATSPLGRARPHTPLALAGIALALASAVAACTGERPRLADETSTTEEPTTTTTEPEPADAEVAQAKAPSIDVYASEDADAADRRIESGVDTSAGDTPIVFLVKGRQEGDARIEVYLPIDPSGSTGWVDADDVALSEVGYRIEVGMSQHQLRVYRDDEMILDEPAGVGCGEGFVPGGVYYLKELLQRPDPDGDYGTYAYGLSGFANVLESLDDGTDVTAIHGTNEPDTVGTDVADGCVRLRNEAIERMVDEIGLPLGTPVEVQA